MSRKAVATLILMILAILDSACASAAPPTILPYAVEIEAVQAAESALAGELGIAIEDVQVVRVEDAEWPDTCLGLGGEGEACAEVIIPGYLVTLQAQGRRYIYRTDRTGAAVRLERVEESGPATAEAAAEPTAEACVPLAEPSMQEYPVPPGSHPHDVAPAPDGAIWYTAQHLGALGRLDSITGETHHIPLGNGSAPHGVIVGPDGAPWITDGGLNAIVKVDPVTEEVESYPLPEDAGRANLNTAAFDNDGVLWFTGQNGVFGRLVPATGEMEVFAAPRGRGPYGITATPHGAVYYASLAGSYVGRIDPATGTAAVLEPPTTNQGSRRVWSDSLGRIWVSQWNAGQVALYDPRDGSWREWRLPGDRPQAYAVFVDDTDTVWLSDFGGNALVRFDAISESFTLFPLRTESAQVRQLLGRPGEVWGAESGTDKLVVLRTHSC